MTQNTLGQQTNLDWVHEQDIRYYHNRTCKGVVRSLKTNDVTTKKSSCPICGRKIVSTLATVVCQ